MFRKRKFKSPKIAEKRRRARLVKWALLLFIIIFSSGALSYVSRIESISLEGIIVSGNSVTSTKEIEAIALERLAGAYFGLFSKKNFLIYPKQEIKEELLQRAKTVRDADISVEDFSVLRIDIEERSPAGMWCEKKIRDEDAGEVKEKAKEETKEKCFFLDSDGFVYSKAPKFSNSAFLKYYGLIEDEPVGARYLLPEEFRALSGFLDILNALNFRVLNISIDDESDARAGLEDGGEIIFNLKQDYDRLSGDLNSILSDATLKESLEDDDLSLDYIDLRFGNKVYYKLGR